VAIYDNRDSQSGDHTSRDAAGRDIVHQGADASQVLAFLRSYVFEADQRRETAIKELHRELRLSRGDTVIVSDVLRTVRDRVDDLIVDRDVDKLDREDRQSALDGILAAHKQEIAALRAEQRRTRRVLFWFGVGIIAALAVAAWLTYDRLAALALARYWLGGGAALAYHLWRGR
jgi:hypothetical protein